ncbi:dTDP-glucose 4,6-dehydratase [Gorillibacterium sp. sgz500922]|uniref:dTDP-glucose 4,6-dehydratase n=1 Tax=Gorillibacterium sp. sgz500922 TaxID=3446694 RepID=UPI003F668938
MRMLVTGGAGFIGSNFIRYMMGREDIAHIVNLDKLTYAGNPDNVREWEGNPRYTFIRGDIAERKLVSHLMKAYKIDTVVNFAAESHVDRSIARPEVFVETNVLGTQSLLDAARAHGVAKFVQVSTDEVYGSLGREGYFTETTPLAPNSPYSASKAGSDLLVRAYHETYGMNVNITRCSNNYGPYQFPEKLIPLMITKALANEPLPVYGDGLNVRDWLHVEDHAAAVELVVRSGRPGEVYNIGGHNEQTNLEIVRLILAELGKPESLIRHVADRLGHDRRYAIDPAKITAELGWTPRYTFAVGIRETIRWYLANETWWRRIESGEYQAAEEDRIYG